MSKDLSISGGVLDITNVPGEPLRNPQLSLKTKGIFSVIMEKGHAKLSDILSVCTDGERAVRSGIKELIGAGYLYLSKSNKSDGTFAGVRYFVDWERLPLGRYPHVQNSNAVESSPITKDIKLHSSQSKDHDVPSDKKVIKKRAGKLPKTDPELTRYLRLPDPSEYIDDITDDDDMLTLRHVYDGTTWQLKFARNFWKLCHQHGSLTVPQWMKRALVLQQWADAFDKIVRTKKGTKDQVVMVMRWLMEIDDFWFRTGNLATPNKFHQSHKKDGHNNRFDFFLSKAMMVVPAYPTPKYTYPAGTVEEILKWHPSLSMDDFKRAASSKYMFIPEQD